MKQLLCGVKSILAIVAIMLSPIALVYALPLALGLGLDMFALPAERLAVFALWGVAGVMLLRRVLRHLHTVELGDPAEAGPRVTLA